MIELVAFLGNPGREYRKTRHNAGRLAAEQLPFFSALQWRRSYKGQYACIERRDLLSYPGPAAAEGGNEPLLSGTCHLLMPETYMNLSGESIYEAALFFKIPPERILLVHDELELALGYGGLKFSGGLGGHNGLRSMKARFNTPDFWRLRIGIGRPDHADIAGWVLSEFTLDEKPVLEQTLKGCAETLILGLVQEPGSLLPGWNKKKLV